MKIKDGVKVLILAVTALFIMEFPAFSAEPLKPLTLEESLDIALQQSLTIRSAKEGIAAAEAQRKEASSAFLPKFSTTYSYTRLNDEPYFHFPGVPPLLPPSTLIMGTRDNYTWAFEVKQPIFAGGAIRESYRINKLGQDVSSLEENVKTLDTIEQVKVSYFTILKAERIRDVARQSVEQLQAHQKTALGFYDVHMIPRNDLLRAEVELANGQKFLLKAENGVEMAKSSFNTLLRRDINTLFEVEDILALKPFEKPLDACMQTALENRPEIKAYTLKVKQTESMVQIARSEYFPTISTLGHFERFGDDPDVSGSTYKDKESWYLSAVATWTFWEWGKTKDRVDASLARVNQMDYTLTLVQDQIRLEVKNAFLELKNAEQQVRVAYKAIEQAEENFRINQERYREQLATSTDVIDAQTLLTKAKSDYATALGDYNISYSKLERAMGVINE